ncbi:MAG TPA: hypothetical protein VGC85_02415 [Chthoniobacterales bacterium]
MINPKSILALILAVTSLLPLTASTSKGAGLSIEIGDRPYYNRGAYYEERGRRWCWVPGHRGRYGRWIHGHYRPCHHRW